MFSLAYNLPKNHVKLLPIKITSKETSKNNMPISKLHQKKYVNFSTSEITLIKVRGNNLGFSTIEITSKKVRGNNMDFWAIEIASKKLRGNNVHF